MTETATAEAANAPTITLVDLQNALRIIDAAAERGAFRGHELSSVGATRDKIAGFLALAMPEEKNDGTAVDGEATAEATAETAPKAPARKGRTE